MSTAIVNDQIVSLAWTKLTGTPTTLAGYGITDPIVLTSGSYANPAWITSLAASKLTGTLGVGNGGTGTSTAFTAGSVVFAGASGVYSQDNTKFFWDSTNNKFYIGSAGEVQMSLMSDIGNISADTDAFLRFTIDGGAGLGSLKGIMGYDQGLDRFVCGYGPGGWFTLDSVGNLATTGTGASIRVANAALAGTGTGYIVFGDGTAPSSLASNTAAIYGDDVGGTVAMRGINEAGDISQITPGFIPVPRDLAPGSFTVQTGRYIITPTLTLANSDTATLQGTAVWVQL